MMKNISRVDINVALFMIITEKVMVTSVAESLELIVRKLDRSVKRVFLYQCICMFTRPHSRKNCKNSPIFLPAVVSLANEKVRVSPFKFSQILQRR